MRRIKIRATTVLLAAVAIGLVVIGVLYFTDTAANLPSFVPGHLAHSTKHHYKHGMAAITLAIAAFVGAWLTTAPERAA